jgi:ABC-type microcin C transport system permease subunit YejE
VDRSVNSSTSAVSSSNTVLKSTLRIVCQHHDSLCDISEFVNRTYSLQILLSVTLALIGVLLAAHIGSVEFSYTSILQLYSSKQILSVSTIVWLFVTTAKVVQLVVVCNRASHELSACSCGVRVSPL